MVIEVFISVSGMSSNRRRISPRWGIGTPTLPTSPLLSGSAGSYPVWVGRSKATDRPVWPLARLVRYSALDAAGVECPAEVRITHGRSFSGLSFSVMAPRVGRQLPIGNRVWGIRHDGGDRGVAHAVAA